MGPIPFKDNIDDLLLAPVACSSNLGKAQSHITNNGVASVDEEVMPAPMSVETWLDTWSKEQIREMQRSDPVVSKILTWKNLSLNKPLGEETRGSCIAVKTYLSHRDELRVNDGLLYKAWQPPHSKDETLQLVVPLSMRKFIFNQLHCKRTAGHFGISRTVKQDGRDSSGKVTGGH